MKDNNKELDILRKENKALKADNEKKKNQLTQLLDLNEKLMLKITELKSVIDIYEKKKSNIVVVPANTKIK